MASSFDARPREGSLSDAAEHQSATGELLAQIDLLRADLTLREAALAQKEAELAAIHASLAWRLAAPVRGLGHMAQRARAGLRQSWIWLNHVGRRAYRRLFTRAPRLAEAIRTVAAPVFARGNRAILKRVYVPALRGLPAVTLDQPGGRMVFQAPGPIAPFAPLVTVLVPNYNHAPYLRQRLDSVFAQTYPHLEVLLMDDGSGDDSRAILSDYAARHPGKARLIFNAQNSGGAFFQWEKGIREAKGQLIWIAESDDWCDANFLETLVPFFANAGVQLAYAPSIFMNEAGTEEVWTLWDYLAGLGAERWRAPFVLPAPVIVREAFAARNIIPNTSSAVFRRPDPGRLAALESEIWRGMRTCGDWVFYLNLIRGGLLAYSPATQNYYRQHKANTSVGSFAQDRYYAEHQEVAKTVQRHYRVDPSVFVRQRQDLALHWTRHRGGLSAAGLLACYDLEAITAEAARRKPNILMASYAFAPGGGETFPVLLANLMKTAGFTVTYLNCDQEPAQPGLRAQLASDIPVLSDFEDLGAILRDFDIALIHSHHAWVDNTVLDHLPEDSPARTVITLHGMYETVPEGQLKRMLPRLVQRTAKMVHVARKNTEAMVRTGGMDPQALVRIDNALPRGKGQPVPRADLGIPEAAFVLTVVSRGMPEKGWAEAIEAVGRAREISGRDIHLVILGVGPEYDRLSPRAPDHVHFLGFRANTRDYFATADLGLLPSRFKGESFPLVVIDCLNAGRPVLASDLGEIAGMLQTPEGLAGEVFALQDWQVPIEPLAQRIAALAADPAALAALTARAAGACAKFDPERMAAAYAAVYVAAAGITGTQG
jgi:glycosyltransferase involved in cell wall biosynthesis